MSSWKTDPEQLLAPLADKKTGAEAATREEERGEGVGRAGEGRKRGGFRGLGWVGQTDPDRVNSECTLLRGGLRFAENISPFRPRVLSAPPPPSRGGQCDFEIWIGAGDGQNLCLQRSASRERGKGGGGGEKFPGCFLLFYPPFFRFFGFSFLFFFRVLVVNSCGWDFCSFCFLSFFFSIVKKGILGETFSVCCYRWSCVVVVFDLSDDSFFFGGGILIGWWRKE